MREVCCWGKCLPMEKDGCSHPRSLTDSARKSNRKEILANFNKTRINIEHQHDHWMELKKELSVQTHAEVHVVRKLGHA